MPSDFMISVPLSLTVCALDIAELSHHISRAQSADYFAPVIERQLCGVDLLIERSSSSMSRSDDALSATWFMRLPTSEVGVDDRGDPVMKRGSGRQPIRRANFASVTRISIWLLEFHCADRRL